MLEELEKKHSKTPYQYNKSANTLNWKVLETNERLARTLSQKFNIDYILSSLLLNRGVDSIENAECFLNGKLKDIMPDPFLMQDMEKAADRIVQAIVLQEKITVFADYDVDGATSAATLHNFFKALNIKIDIYVPSRLLEGYGPNVQAMHKIKATGTNLLITVDCGTTSYEPLMAAHELGMEVIVIDHHIAPEELPMAHAIVNPNRADDLFPYKSIAAVAVAFFTIIAVRKKLRDIDWFKQNKIAEPELLNFLDIVALGTVCDVMPLTGINRIFVKHGLHLIAQRKNLGISTLLDIARVRSKPQSYHLGYVIGPRINAGGRVDESSLGVSLLISENPSEVYKLAARLEQLNEERKTIEATALSEAIEYIDRTGCYVNPIIIASGQEWHIGILGILASRIKERYNKPVVVISINNGIGKGSARSVAGIDVGQMITSAKATGLLLDGGGHAMAGGFSIKEELIDRLSEYAIDYIANQNESEFLIEKASEIYIDAVISTKAANISLVKALEKMEPFGNANQAPRFAIYKATLLKVSVFAQAHLLLTITDSAYGEIAKHTHMLKCVFFRGLEKSIGPILLESVGKVVDIIGNLQENKIDKSGIQFIVEDIILYEQ